MEENHSILKSLLAELITRFPIEPEIGNDPRRCVHMVSNMSSLRYMDCEKPVHINQIFQLHYLENIPALYFSFPLFHFRSLF